MVDAAVDVAELGFGDGALEPGSGLGVVAELIPTVPDLMDAGPEAFMVDAAVDVAELGFGDGAFEPGSGLGVVAELIPTVPDYMDAGPEAFMVDAAVDVAELFSVTARSNQGRAWV